MLISDVLLSMLKYCIMMFYGFDAEALGILKCLRYECLKCSRYRSSVSIFLLYKNINLCSSDNTKLVIIEGNYMDRGGF